MSESTGAETKIHPDTSLGYVQLSVSDLERSIAFYEGSLGFQLRHREGRTAYLGAGGDDLLVLSEISGATLPPRRSGLYHFAILTPSRLALGKALKNLVDTQTPISGGADHLVSEAIYLPDPDGNGIEIYRDRQREAWGFENGQLKMDTLPLDYQGLLGEEGVAAEPWEGLHPETVLGHMHLHVADLAEATNFYEKVIGLDLMVALMGSAAFLSAGGYHHHLGINTWNGVGAPPPPPDSVGLVHFSVQLPNEGETGKLVSRLEAADVSYERRGEGLFVRDPSENGILFTVSP